jgi:hypothetical protein
LKKQYIKKYHIDTCNYYKNARHLTNNSCECYNCKLNNIFNKNPSFYKFLYELRIEEKDILTYEKRKSGLLGNENKRRTKIENKTNLIYDKCIDIEKLPGNDISEIRFR